MSNTAWQPIETAPKDGTSVKVKPVCGYTQAFYDEGTWWWEDLQTPSIAAGPEPLEWMPLPKAPE